MTSNKQPDPAHVETDRIIEQIEKEITEEYRIAHKEVTAKMDDYLARFVTKDKKWQEWVANGSKTQAEYKQWKKGQVLMGQRWGELKDSLAQDYANAAKISRSIANGYRPEVYALNHNYATFDIEKKSQLDTSYTLYSRESVERMYRDNPRLYHKPGQTISKEIKEGKLAQWDKRRIQSVITQGILQGESIPQLTKRLEQVTGGDHKAAIRNIRTMMTGVQNAGRIDAQERAKKMGIPVQKQWMATLDSRTRHWHRDLDGVAVDLDEPFENDMGKIMFPGDPDADPANIYNCRCTLLSAIKGHEIDLSDTSLRHDKNLGKMSYDEWKDAKSPVTSNPITLPEEKAASIRQRYINEYAEGHGGSGGPHRYTAEEGQRLMDEWVRENTPQTAQTHNIAEGKDITGTWNRRAGQFDFAIDDVINAQGYDGVPRVVSANEFDDRVKASGLYGQRVYSANSEEILHQYREELYHGKFYVDCSVGGSDFGQGMYMSGDFTGKKIADVKEDSERYIAISKSRGNKYSNTERMTLDKDAKVIKYDKLSRQYSDEAVKIKTEIRNTTGHKAVESAVKEHGLTEEDRNFLLWGLNISEDVEPFDVTKAMAYSGDKTKIGEIRKGIENSIRTKQNQNPIVIANGDMGIYGTLKGYDAINIEGQAANGTSQVLVLNRTKLIIRGES